MPQIRYYTVTQTREVKISANDVVQAAQFANAVFMEKPTDVPATLLKPIRICDLCVKEDR